MKLSADVYISWSPGFFPQVGTMYFAGVLKICDWSDIKSVNHRPDGLVSCFCCSHDVAEIAGLTTFSFGEDEVDRYVMLFKKVTGMYKKQ